MPYRELTELPMSDMERRRLARYRDLLQEDHFLATDVRWLFESTSDVRISAHERRVDREAYHERIFFRDGWKAHGLGWKLPDPGEEHLSRVGRRNLSAFQKGWCAAEREASRAV